MVTGDPADTHNYADLVKDPGTSQLIIYTFKSWGDHYTGK